jgi:hypothetical protein
MGATILAVFLDAGRRCALTPRLLLEWPEPFVLAVVAAYTIRDETVNTFGLYNVYSNSSPKRANPWEAAVASLRLMEMDMRTLPTRLLVGLGLAGMLAVLAGTATSQTVSRPYTVTIKDEMEQVVEPILPVDPVVAINLTSFPGMSWGLKTMDGKRLTFSDGSAQTRFKIDGNIVQPGGAKMPLPPKKGSKVPRHGSMYEYTIKDVHITQTHEVIPSKLPGPPKAGQKRKMDVVLFKTIMENRGNQEVKIAMRVGMDAYNAGTDGPALGVPATGKVLDGAFVEGKDVPDYVLSMETRDIKNPGHKAYFTFDQGGKWERPSKVVVSTHGVVFGPGWEVAIQQNQFDTDYVLYWAEKPLKAKEKRVIMFGYGTGLATNPENEGRVTPTFGGSFEPNKSFTITALVEDPVESQSLTLKLPAGMTLLEGKETQPVPPADNDNRSVVFWKCQLLKTGTFPIQIQSSNGVTLTKSVTVEKSAQ